jgi:hypothetical protein
MGRKKTTLDRKGLVNGRVDDQLFENRLCKYLADWGFGIVANAAATELTPCQIAYRMRKNDQRVSEYRRGETEIAKGLIKSFRKH